MLYTTSTQIFAEHKHNIRNSMNEGTYFFIKIYLSHFILDWVMFLLCLRYERETWTDCYIEPKFFFDHSSTFFSSWLGCSTVGHWKCKALSLRAGSHASASCLQLTRTSLGTWLYHCLTSTCFRCSSAYLRRCISWLTARSRVNI